MHYEDYERCPHCNLKPLTYRLKAGEKNWICGNGHNWTSKESFDKALADAQKKRYPPPYRP